MINKTTRTHLLFTCCLPVILIICPVFFMTGCETLEERAPRSENKGFTGPENFPRPYMVNGKWYQPLARADGFKQKGVASWYGDYFHGRKTSSGETYDMNAVSAAHKTLPLGTYVRVHNVENGKSLDVRINDRGPFVAGRVIDLSKAAAEKLDIYEPGTAQVRVTALGTAKRSETEFGPVRQYIPGNYQSGSFSIQVGAFRDRHNAENLMKNLDKKYKNSHILSYYRHSDGALLYRVLMGRASNLKQAEKYQSILRRNGFKNAFVVAE